MNSMRSQQGIAWLCVQSTYDQYHLALNNCYPVSNLTGSNDRLL